MVSVAGLGPTLTEVVVTAAPRPESSTYCGGPAGRFSFSRATRCALARGAKEMRKPLGCIGPPAQGILGDRKVRISGDGGGQDPDRPSWSTSSSQRWFGSPQPSGISPKLDLRQKSPRIRLVASQREGGWLVLGAELNHRAADAIRDEELVSLRATARLRRDRSEESRSRDYEGDGERGAAIHAEVTILGTQGQYAGRAAAVLERQRRLVIGPRRDEPKIERGREAQRAAEVLPTASSGILAQRGPGCWSAIRTSVLIGPRAAGVRMASI